MTTEPHGGDDGSPDSGGPESGSPDSGSPESGSPGPASPPATPEAGPASRADLDAYLAANSGRFTDEALYATLVAAGHAPDDVRAGLKRAWALRRESPTQRARRTILIAYFGVFAVLSIGMLLNGRGRGYLMPDAAGGIALLAGSLGVALVASFVWVASRRLFGLLILLLVVAYGVSALASGAGAVPLSLLIVLVFGGGLVLLGRRKGSGIAGVGGGGVETDIGVLLVLPLLLLIGIAGLCLASGLPIPGSA